MGREIKFRAWHKGAYDSLGRQVFSPRMIYDKWNGECCRFVEEGQPVELMQYTGFHDKIGKEIYDGDILSKKWVVEWENERGFWVIFNPALHYCALGEGLYAVPELEVVGNIYENMELWETDKDE
jgi:hypothetical protein